MITGLLGDMLTSGGLSAGLGAGLSMVSKLLARQDMNDKLRFARGKEELEMIMHSQDAANNRGGRSGQFIRRYIVVMLFTFITLFLFAYGILQGFVEVPPATYAYMEHIPERWFGMIRAKSVLRTTELPGVPVFQVIVNMCWLIGTFYFGSSRIK